MRDQLFMIFAFIVVLLNVNMLMKVVALGLLFFIWIQKNEQKTEAPKPKSEYIKFNLCSLCDEEPLDAFNTYRVGARDERPEKNYRAGLEHAREWDQIKNIYSDKKTYDIDDLSARRQIVMQERSRESSEHRSRLNPNTFRAYFGEEQETAENLSWWGIDQAVFQSNLKRD
jgi:hypothetical protein